jgi:ankyrin repeat protein
MKDLADEFIDLACLCYDDPHFDHRSFHLRAHEMLRKNPEVAETSIWSAATAGNAAAIRSFLDENPDLVNQPGGPHGWAPLICACYSRVKPVDPAHSTFEAAKLLLDRGADPNVHTMKHNDPPGSDRARRFSALTGLFGGGSTGMANQPAHPRWRELAELLLERGADPADEQALHINQGSSLPILLRHGLRPDAQSQDAIGAITLMGRELCQAARRGRTDIVKLLLAHQARTDEVFDGKTPWQHAMEHGHLEIARMLEEAGAPAAQQTEVERFLTLCMAGDEIGARTMLERAPDLLARAPNDLVTKAVNTGREEAVNLGLDLGFDPDWMDENAALHSAAGEGNEKIVRLLISRGASLTLREPWYDGTAVEWAEFFDHRELRDMLLNEAAICLFDALDYDRLDRVPDILARDPTALNRSFAECISRKPKPEDRQTPLVRMVDRGKTQAVSLLLDCGADIGARHSDGRSLLQLASDKGFAEIVNLLKQHGAA